MRKLSIILILVVTISFYSCNEDKENLYGQIVGRWNLVSCRENVYIDMLLGSFETYFNISDSLNHQDYRKAFNFKDNGFLDIEHHPSGIEQYHWSIRKNTLIINYNGLDNSCEIYGLTITEFHFKIITSRSGFVEFELER